MRMDPRQYQRMVIEHGLRYFEKHGVPINRNYTPKRMLLCATKITGNTYKRNDAGYLAAADDIKAVRTGAS